MKRVLILLCSLVLLGGLAVFIQDKKDPKVKKDSFAVLTPTPVSTQSLAKTSLFVPYWSLSEEATDFSRYDQLLYFGIMPSKIGINTEDTGYGQLPVFVTLAGNREKLLVLRMLDSQMNFAILKDPKLQKLIIQEVVSLAEEYRFNGVVLDLELAALPFDSLIQQINTFNRDLAKALKREDLSYGITVYGDTYYRVRPFDIATLAESADQVMVMAYDLYKSGGSPGPNFPLSGKEKYGYDYSLLLDKFLSEVPPEKITVIFGLYGYDWQVDDKNISQKTGKPLSYLEIQKTIMDNCQILQCAVTRDPLSGETMIRYMAEDGKKHVVWYEDMESVKSKRNYLKKRGVYNFSFWAHSYF